MCFITYNVCPVCREEHFNTPGFCCPNLCKKVIYFQEWPDPLCHYCYFERHKRMDTSRRRDADGYLLRSRFVLARTRCCKKKQEF